MRVLAYLLKTTMKNRIKQLVKKPGLLVLTILGCVSMIAILVLNAVGATNTNHTNNGDIRMLYSIIAGIGLLFMISFVFAGTNQGNTLFNMGDVGLLFVAPISTKKVLLYGMIKQLGTTFLSSIFIIFQVTTIKQNFDISMSIIFSMFFIYAVMLFLFQLLSIAIFVYCKGNRSRKQRINLMLYIVIGIPVIWILIRYQQLGSIKEALYQVIDAKEFELYPVIGWTVSFCKAAVEHNIAGIIFALALYVIASCFIIWLFTARETDFYESVLVCTEKRYHLIKDSKEGRVVSYRTKKRKIKNEDAGIRHGKGAATIFYKHLVEMKRESRIPFLSSFTVFCMIGAGLACKISNSEYCGYVIFAFLVYLNFIMVAVGKLSTEIKKPFLYLIPEPPLKKLIYTCLSEMIKPCIDGLLIFGVVFIFGKESLLLCLFLAIAFALTGIVFNAIPVFYQRFFGGSPHRVLMLMIEMVMLLFLLSPGIVVSVLVTTSTTTKMAYLGTLPYSINCILLAGILFFASRNVLEKAEL